MRHRGRLPVWAQLAWRAALVIGLLAFTIALHWFGHISFLDVVYFTMISITTNGYGDIVPVANYTRLFDALAVTPIRIFFVLVLVLIFIGTAYTFVFRRTWDKWRMKRLQQTLRDPVVVVKLSERVVTDEECGKPLAALARGIGVRIYRDVKPYGFWEPEAQALRPGACVVEILPTAEKEAELG